MLSPKFHGGLGERGANYQGFAKPLQVGLRGIAQPGECQRICPQVIGKAGLLGYDPGFHHT